MIVNAKENVVHVIVEIDSNDIKKILKGQTIYQVATRSEIPIIIECYCSQPDDHIEEDD